MKRQTLWRMLLTAVFIFLMSLSPWAAQADWHQVGAAGFSAGEASYISLAFAGATPYVAYQDIANGNKASVMKFDGTDWVQVGSAGFSSGWVDNISLAIDSSGTPYVAYEDWAISGISYAKASVMKFNGTTWEQVGAAGFSPNGASLTSIDIDSSGMPYVAYMEWIACGPTTFNTCPKASVMKFNGTVWEQVDADFPIGGGYWIRIAIDSSDTPYVAYQAFQDWATMKGPKVIVMKFNGATWEQVGTGVSPSWVQFLSLSIDNNGTPYVAYQDGANNIKASVMKFNGITWEQVGAAGFSLGNTYRTSLAISSKNTPYVAYQDGAKDYKASVMKFNGSAWEQVGIAGFSYSSASYTSLAIDSNDTPYVAYQDGANGNKASVMKFITNKVNMAPVFMLLQ